MMGHFELLSKEDQEGCLKDYAVHGQYFIQTTKGAGGEVIAKYIPCNTVIIDRSRDDE